jgi:hypothetical protein
MRNLLTEVIMTEPATKNIGIIGIYDDVNDLVAAAAQVRDAGYKNWDCHTPYPVHGLDDAMGIKPSILPVISLSSGFLGLAMAIGMTGGLSAGHYPIRIGGKALLSWQAFMPIYFELFVLFAAFAALFGMIGLCKLGRWHSPLHDSGVMSDITCNRFAIVIDASDKKFSEKKTRAMFEKTNCKDIRPLVEFEEEDEALI